MPFWGIFSQKQLFEAYFAWKIPKKKNIFMVGSTGSVPNAMKKEFCCQKIRVLESAMLIWSKNYILGAISGNNGRLRLILLVNLLHKAIFMV